MPTTPEAIIADINEAAAAGFRGHSIARGQARAIIWRDGVLPPDAPAFAPQLSYDLHSYGYALLGLGLRLRELGGGAAQARIAFEQAATALEAVVAKGNRQEVDRGFHFVMAAAGYHLAHFSARAYSLLAIVEADENFSPIERDPHTTHDLHGSPHRAPPSHVAINCRTLGRGEWDLCRARDGRPLGVKAIASHLNERGIHRRGRRFTTGGIHDILTATTYHGLHHFNRSDSRRQRVRPPSQWISLSVPAIVDEKSFNTAQALLQSRAPKRVPPRVVNGPTILSGIARCGHCGSAMIQNTGKGGAYRYYCCSRRLKEGTRGCQGIRIRMDRLDGIVVGEVARRVLDPDRLESMLRAYVRTSLEREDRNRERMRGLRQAHKEADAGITRLLELVEKGLMDADDSTLRERLVNLRFRRDELAEDIADLHKRLSSAEPSLTPEKIGQLAILLRDKLHTGPPDLRQAYARLLLREVSVDDEKIHICGSKAVLARTAAEGPATRTPAVLSFVREWCTGEDSNL